MNALVIAAIILVVFAAVIIGEGIRQIYVRLME